MTKGTGEGECKACGYMYTPKEGDDEYPVPKGTQFQVSLPQFKTASCLSQRSRCATAAGACVLQHAKEGDGGHSACKGDCCCEPDSFNLSDSSTIVARCGGALQHAKRGGISRERVGLFVTPDVSVTIVSQAHCRGLAPGWWIRLQGLTCSALLWRLCIQILASGLGVV